MSNYIPQNIKEDLHSIYLSTDWSKYKDRTVLITGANGHIASLLVYSFAYANSYGETGVKIIANSRNRDKLYHLFGSLDKESWFEIVACDVKELDQLDKKIDYIFHFAGNASPYFIKNDPVGILDANIAGTFCICELAKRNPGSKVIFSSSREVYGNNPSAESLTETSFGSIDPMEPRSCYPESKRAAETIISAYARQYGIRFDILRIAHCYGPGMKLSNDGRVMSDFLNYAINHQDIVLNSTGEALRSFIYISDVIRAILLISSTQGSDVWNLSNETEEISVANLAKNISEIIGDIKVILRPQSDNSAVYTNYRRIPLDCTKLTNMGWSPQIDLRSGLLKTIASYLTKL